MFLNSHLEDYLYHLQSNTENMSKKSGDRESQRKDCQSRGSQQVGRMARRLCQHHNLLLADTDQEDSL